MDNQYDDSAKGGYSYEEKLKLVAAGNMDPKEIGLPPAQEGERAAQDQLPKEPPFIGDFIKCEIGEVPIGIRAHWSRKELAIQPANPRGWEADWIEEHAKEHLIRGIVHSGNQRIMMQLLVEDEPTLAMIKFMKEAANELEKKFTELHVATQDSQPDETKPNE